MVSLVSTFILILKSIGFSKFHLKAFHRIARKYHQVTHHNLESLQIICYIKQGPVKGIVHSILQVSGWFLKNSRRIRATSRLYRALEKYFLQDPVYKITLTKKHKINGPTWGLVIYQWRFRIMGKEVMLAYLFTVRSVLVKKIVLGPECHLFCFGSGTTLVFFLSIAPFLANFLSPTMGKR